MRCVECETDPQTPGHYCECCGRKLSLAKTAAVESTTASSTAVEGSGPPQRRTRSMGLTVVAVLAGATSFGVGSYWLNGQQSPTPQLEPQTAVATEATGSEREPSLSPTDVPLVTEAPTYSSPVPPAPSPPQAATSAQPAAAAPRARVQPKAIRPPTPSADVAPASPSSAPPAAPPSVVEAPVPQPAAAAPPPPEPLALAREPFFTTTDVTESPRVATRVEPRLPDEFRNRPINDVVVVRLLVSQTGHPSRVSLLRRSKAGLPLDNAVVAAVNQWTFSPARKKGEAVSCWYNLGVPIQSAE